MCLLSYSTSFSNVHQVHIPPCRLLRVLYKTLTTKALLNSDKRKFSLGCVFSCLGPWISVLPNADHPDPAALLSAPAFMGVGHSHKITQILNIVPTNLPPKVCLTAH